MQEKIFLESELIGMAYDFLTLLGTEVRLDRGGHESRQGTVVAGGSDYVVIYNEKDGLIYYNTGHIKSITQNTKNVSVYQEVEGEGLPGLKIIEADNFAGLLKNMKNLWCQVNRGGHESVQGVIADSSDEYITLVVNHELVTIFNYHIKSVSYGVKKEQKDDKKDQKQGNNENSNEKNDKNSNDKNSNDKNSNEKNNNDKNSEKK